MQGLKSRFSGGVPNWPTAANAFRVCVLADSPVPDATTACQMSVRLSPSQGYFSTDETCSEFLKHLNTMVYIDFHKIGRAFFRTVGITVARGFHG